MNIRKWIRCAAAIALSAWLAVSAAACSQPANIESGAVAQEYPVTINELTLNAKPKKVAVLSGSLADVVLAIGYETSLSLAGEDCTQPELQVLQKVSATDAETMISSGVDLVLAESIDDATQTALTEANVPVLVLERAKNREDFERLYSQVGTALNGGSTGYNAGVKAAQKIFSSLDDLARLAPESNTVVTACYISDLSGQAVTGDELGSVMMSYMGLTNIFKGLSGGTFAYEDLKLSDPTMIFCTEDVRGQLLSDTQYANLTAVRTGRVYAINPNYMLWQGRTVYTASIEMMGLAYPELTESSTASVTVDLGTPTPEPSEEPSAEPSPSPAPEYTALAPGDESDEVLAMQTRLSELGYLTVEYGGVYGDVTKEAVTAFQQANGLEANGEASVETLEKLFAEDAKPAEGAGT
ncbi:peptidoglycan-binding protein [Anaeromassilibacillus senegalensis]|uniref:Peptidoglycan-binding protein n=1 Tax=Anaeromassilibacillus senegalensis TaxID=1673717 RepID=A0ABS9CMV6_9FIRM|nr:peptidoglycan-binding protein [Anaeromassilibacillus senegalensis]MCF2652464.1 peptidoglycan-binding protein [Anaeromassilibacillus senegalensis]